ncbi:MULTISPECIES: penicillin-binding protein 1A [unclassified Janthinobacterium]|uniref:penicillin-binding protein 1A n=1 Tax=unclassified Janthinobacterium TaxID=2610881 RepID=UPI000983EE78|nr:MULTISPECIES: penicillin-binding protein 1A [unclassified Janthinobacterium]AQR67510.1 penicillin-binding protein [Janthinobacterium sp. LM6]MDN2678810.1 penicillin-binding protein 1A [Janthinobacterium sp. SUN033]MDN2718280.1 penicillin-binding protein 1A [Janthinobacterium sp. SUN120]MDO8041900.1 penicillin-binding protein 1A [Janthinobacterium sp. SUN137]MDO8049516.1 penicillin-binding protein 1A [Janthinobacterium sp. SUN211]
MTSSKSAGPAGSKPPTKGSKPKRFLLMALVSLLGLGIVGVLLVVFGLAMAYPNLPALDTLTDYKPKMPLRVFTSDSVLIGEFGEERRNMVHIKDIPDVMKKAVLAIEDDRFYEHGGVDYLGITRAALHNLTGGAKQGASTITQQVARNFFLSSEQTLKRKAYEVLLAWKIEKNLSKDQILEVYMNQIYLGQRAYGFASAAQIYFGKNIQDLTVAEAAMLAGLPKAPSAYNPVVNPKRARMRQQYILQRMAQLGYITPAQYEEAKNEELKVKTDSSAFGVHAEYVSEMARQLVYEQFKEDTYTRGLNVYTTITKADQDAAYIALRKGVMDYEKRHGYRGPEAYIEIPKTKAEADDAIETELADHPDSDDIIAAMVLQASPKSLQAVTSAGEEITITGPGLTFGAAWLSEKAAPNRRIKRGAVIRVMQEGNTWVLTQMPEVQSAFVSASTTDGAIRAMVGGFDYNRNKFNHVTQAWRQPGSAFKPFIYSASLERGLSPATIINDAPISFDAGQTGGQAWEPKNYDSKYDGPMTMRKGLMKSKNMISIRILHKIGAKYGQEYATRFGFDADKNPPYLTLALGAGNVTPLQMAGAYAVFANGGYKINPYLIAKVTDSDGNVLSQAKPDLAGEEANRVIDERNAFMMNSMLNDVVRFGTANKAMALKRPDLAGKTGTTNDSIDAWFAGYQAKLVGIAWIGYDQPRNLGNRETGGGLALPIWISYMAKALKSIPVEERAVPEGLIHVGDEYYYAENPPGTGVGSLEGAARGTPEEEKAKEAVKNELF